MSQQPQPQPESDCLTVLCFKVTSLTQEKAQLQNEVQRLNFVLNKTAKEATEHNDKAQDLARQINHRLNTYAHGRDVVGPSIEEAVKLCDELEEHLK